jgi:hypothetical protein
VQRQIEASGDYWSWNGSLILGTAARLRSSVSLHATSGSLADSKLWWWLDEMDLSAFFGELDGERGDYARPCAW